MIDYRWLLAEGFASMVVIAALLIELGRAKAEAAFRKDGWDRSNAVLRECRSYLEAEERRSP